MSHKHFNPQRKFVMKKKMLVVATLAACTGSAYAADTPAVPTLSQILGASNISVSGYIDAAYNYMNSTGLFINAPKGVSVVGGTAGNSHIFDTQGAISTKNFSSFNLQQAALIVSMQPKEGFGGFVNITAGQDAATIASSGLGDNTSSHSFDLTQAYASYATGPLTVIGGKFATLAGAELITSPSNSNYTRAWMFGWGPYTHTGVRATYVANDMITLIGGVNNGFDQVNSATGGKTVELGLDITPSSMFSLATSYYVGKGLVGATPGQGTYLDMVGTINATDKLNFVFDYANASQDGATVLGGVTGKAKWDSLALYANYHFNDTWRISYRNEDFNDKDGFRSGLTYDGVNVIGGAVGTPAAQKLKSNTITVGYAATKSMELRAEARWDKSDQNAFLQTDGTGKSTQSTYALEAVYQF
jgi:Putative beta-barrel porin-2, OmpL-like. bbp2